MMRKYILSLLLLAVLVFVAAGCHHKPTMREMGIVLDTLCSSSVATLTDSVGSPTCEVDIELIALQNKEYAPVMDSLIRSGILAPEYLSLTDRTRALESTDPLANDPLKYERWAELFAEGQWWFDIRRWRIGPSEAEYYKQTSHGPITWKGDCSYVQPIPQLEIARNANMKQSEGY